MYVSLLIVSFANVDLRSRTQFFFSHHFQQMRVATFLGFISFYTPTSRD
jgi:hypothetical protein